MPRAVAPSNGILHGAESHAAVAVGKPCAVADRRDGRVCRHQVVVDEDAVVHGQPCRPSQLTVGNCTDTDDDQVGRQLVATGSEDAPDGSVDAGDPVDRLTEPQTHTCCGMPLGQELAGHRRDGAVEKSRSDLDHRDAHAESGSDRGQLEADEAAAHEDDRAGGAQVRAEPTSVVECPQRVHAGQPAAGDRHRPRVANRGPGPGGHRPGACLSAARPEQPSRSIATTCAPSSRSTPTQS